MIFQCMFAVITPALIVGAFAERMRFSAFLIFTLLWATFVYDPVCHWVWGVGGWLKELGVIDFAGGSVVHINAGIAALVTALVIGKRTGYKNRPVPPAQSTLYRPGRTALLWFGWFGFNAGAPWRPTAWRSMPWWSPTSPRLPQGSPGPLLEWVLTGKPTLFGTITGSIAGLATITAASGFVAVLPAVAIGVIASVVCFLCVSMLKPQPRVRRFPRCLRRHGIGGILGMLTTGLFASRVINQAGADGLSSATPGSSLPRSLPPSW